MHICFNIAVKFKEVTTILQQHKLYKGNLDLQLSISQTI